VNLLASSLRRFWLAKSRVPHLTGWGTSGFLSNKTTNVLASPADEAILVVKELLQKSTPTIVLILWNILR
jgi:hypothetical protein